MESFDIFIAYIEWEGNGKTRPVLVMERSEKIFKVFSITTQYKSKSVNIRAKYLKIKDWKQAGLDKQSYIDTNQKIDLPDSIVSGKSPIGRLTEKDKLALLAFIK